MFNVFLKKNRNGKSDNVIDNAQFGVSCRNTDTGHFIAWKPCANEYAVHKRGELAI